MVTIKDIARKCNVSIATVSNVINDRGKVSEMTQKLIWETARELNYVPNYMARNLKQKQKKNIGIIAEDLTIFHTPAVVDGINMYLDKKDYTFLLGNMRMFQKHGDEFYLYPEYESKVLEELNIMAAKQVAGIIYIEGHCHTIRCIPEDFPVPIVSVYGFVEGKDIPSILYNDEQGAYDATKALIEKGWKEIGLITGAVESYHTKKRMQGYHRALFDARIPYNPCWTAEGDWSRESGYHMAEELVSQGIKAIFVMNDLMAWGVYDYAREKGYRIGEDLVLIGFDDRELCEVLYPPLSSMHLPLHEMGHCAAKMLVERLEEEKEPEKKEYYIDCKLISRG